MNNQADALPSLEQQLDDLLLRWQELRQRGQSQSASHLAADSPELVEELRRRIRALQSMEALLGLNPGGTPDASPAPAPPDPAATQAYGAGLPPGGHSGAETTIPGYRIEGLLSRGGMGVVYRARQLQPDRPVAIKMILAGRHASPEQRERFKREAEAVARLNHPNVVQIYEVGEHEGQPFFSMEYVAGGSLARRLDEGPVTARQAAELTAVLADAIADAHAHGVVHRDLKPANVLLQESGVRGQESGARRGAVGLSDSCLLTPDSYPKITDFGLAKRLDVDVGHTPTVAFLGTPSYMAPEQAQGRTRDVGPPADVYALGAILYEMLTGRPPFRGETEVETLSQVRSQEPVPPRRLSPKVPRDLETICLKSLRKEPGRRYAGAADLAADLRRFLAGQPIQARPTPWWEVALKWTRRNPAWAALGAVSVAAVAALLLLWASFTADLKRQRDDAVYHRTLADQQRQRAQDLLKRSLDAVMKNTRDLEQARQAKDAEGTSLALNYAMAAVYAETADAFRNAPELAPEDRQEFVDRYVGCSMELLKHAGDLGYFRRAGTVEKLRTDPRLKRVRETPAFKDWMAKTNGYREK